MDYADDISSHSRKALPELVWQPGTSRRSSHGHKKKRSLVGALSFFVEEPVSLKKLKN
jgi:hypothetical protein